MPTYAGPAGWRKIASNRIAPRPKTVEVALGADLVEDDGTLIYDFSKSEIAGGVAPATTIPKVVSDGTVLADDGNVYDTVQAAENAASDWIFIGVGDFGENVVVDTAGLTVEGAGRGSHIDAPNSGDDAVDVQAANVTIKNISVTGGNPGGGAFTGAGVIVSSGNGGDAVTLENVVVRDAESNGLDFDAGNDHEVTDCTIEAGDSDAIEVTIDRVLIDGCRIKSAVSGDGVDITAADVTVAACLINGVGTHGVHFANTDATDGSVTGCRIIGAGDDGVEIASNATGCVVTGNAITGSTNKDIDDQSGDAERAANSDGILAFTQTAEHVNDLGNISGNTTIDLSNGSIVECTLTGDVTFTFSGEVTDLNGNSFTLIVNQDGTGGRSITWPSEVEWANGSKPAVSTGANEKDWYGFISPDGGTTWLGVKSAAALA